MINMINQRRLLSVKCAEANQEIQSTVSRTESRKGRRRIVTNPKIRRRRALRERNEGSGSCLFDQWL